MRVVSLLVAAVAVAWTAAGCGGSGGAPSRHDFILRADAICAAATRSSRAVSPPAGSDPAAVATYLDQVLPILRVQATRLRELRKPDGNADRATLNAYLRALDVTVDHYAALAAAAHRRDTTGVATAEAALRSSPVAALATSYGLRACAQPGATAA